VKRARLLLLAAAAVALVSGTTVWLVARGDGGTSHPHGDAVAFLTGVVEDIAANRYDHAWQTLHPAQKLVVTRGVYVRCEGLVPIPGHLSSIKALRVADEQVVVAGGDNVPVASKAVTFRWTVSAPAKEPSSTTHTVHAVAVNGRWTWIMSPKRFRLYDTKVCS
jgi:hypothetical protein